MTTTFDLMLDKAAAARAEALRGEQQAAETHLIRTLKQALSAPIREALTLIAGYNAANGYAFARGHYRDVLLDLTYNSATDSWSVARNGGIPIKIAHSTGMLEQRLLIYLADLRAELDAAAADVPPALDGPELFTLRGYGRDIALDLAGASGRLLLSDIEHGLAGWLNDYIAPVLQAAQTAVEQGEPSPLGGTAAIPLETFRALNEAVQRYQEALR